MRRKRVGNRPVVLCVDDDDAMLQVMKLTLECQGYTVITAINGPTALDTVATTAVDAVILDYDMPGMNGAELALKMKRLQPGIPKLLFTACAELPAKATAAVEGFCSKLDGLSALARQLQVMLDKVGIARSAVALRNGQSPESGLPLSGSPSLC